MKLQFKVFKSLRHYKREVWHLKNPELKSSMELSIQPSVINGPDQVLVARAAAVSSTTSFVEAILKF